MSDNVVTVAAVRRVIGNIGGTQTKTQAYKLGSPVITVLIKQAGI